MRLLKRNVSQLYEPDKGKVEECQGDPKRIKGSHGVYRQRAEQSRALGLVHSKKLIMIKAGEEYAPQEIFFVSLLKSWSKYTLDYIIFFHDCWGYFDVTSFRRACHRP